MRVAPAIVIAMASAIALAPLTLGSGCGPALAQTGRIVESLHMIDSFTGWAVGVDEGLPALGSVESILRTTDGGALWTDVTPPDPPGQQMRRVYGVDVLDARTAWVSAASTSPQAAVLFHTVDGGQTWTSAALPDVTVPPMDFIDARTGWVVSGSGAVYRSTDGGETWITVAGTTHGPAIGGLPFRRIGSITFLDAARGMVTGVGESSDVVSVYVTRDGGYSWRQQTLPLPPEVTPSGVRVERPTFFPAQDGVLPVPYGIPNGTGVVFYVTHDGGDTWTATTPVPQIQHYRASSFADAAHGWVVDDDGAVYVTTDGGGQWLKMTPASLPAPARTIDFISPEVGWAVIQAPPWLEGTVDGGFTWAPVPYTTSRR
jgi:photosystem II stability/assembly factor-like uncharacterized protein